jgi:2-succinyl-5-enolpyruvyl-6-hydroxy-3-cyclohexene-1-carboxylate synthase
MPSRMEKYYRTNTEIKQRSKINEDLYKNIYDVAEYTNIEGIANIEKTNEIDLTKIKELLNNREEARREKECRHIVKEPQPIVEQSVQLEEEKNYDIRDILNKAKDERNDPDAQYHSLKNTQYNILKNISLKDTINNNDYLEAEEELKELINTITSTSMLNKLGDKELSLNILDELKSSENTLIGNSKSIRAILEEEKQKHQEAEEKHDIDKSFYTSSLSFNDEDFDELKEINVTLKKNNILIKILLFILLVIIIAGTGFVVFNFLK